MSPRFVLGRENVPCVAEVVNRSLKADCTDFKICFPATDFQELVGLIKGTNLHVMSAEMRKARTAKINKMASKTQWKRLGGDNCGKETRVSLMKNSNCSYSNG